MDAKCAYTKLTALQCPMPLKRLTSVCIVYLYWVVHFFNYSAAAVYHDSNFGVTKQPWDVCMTSPNADEFFVQLAAINSSPSTACIFKIKPSMYSMFAAAFDKGGYKDAHAFYWVKANQQVPMSSGYTTSTVEMFIIGYKGGKTDSAFTPVMTSSGQISRANVIITPGVRKYYKDADTNMPLNDCQSPEELAQHFGGVHGHPGENVLVIGGGSGSDVLGFVKSGMNVYCIERNKTMVKGMTQRFNASVEMPEHIPPPFSAAEILTRGLQACVEFREDFLESMAVKEKEDEEAAELYPVAVPGPKGADGPLLNANAAAGIFALGEEPAVEPAPKATDKKVVAAKPLAKTSPVAADKKAPAKGK
jgi:hypothetical protein